MLFASLTQLFKIRWEVFLVGDYGEWSIRIKQGSKFWQGDWDPHLEEISVVALNSQDEGVDLQLVETLQMILRSELARFKVPQQNSLKFTSQEGCCQCGALEHVATDPEYGEGVYPIPMRVTWVCVTCAGLVCPKCCLTIQHSKYREYYHDTYCSQLCLECATPSRERDAKDQGFVKAKAP